MDRTKQTSPRRAKAKAASPRPLPVLSLVATDLEQAQRTMATGMAYELNIDSFFGASHAMRPTGETHTHSFRIQATFVTESVDDNGMICGFREVSDLLDFEAKRYVNRFINDIQPFDVVQPTGENLATVIYRNLSLTLAESMPGGPELVSVTLWENPTSSVRVGMRRAA
jgi:6-pyruvoyltetrahydropterin/6-carboxytetrahydropterin synthase